ncbi:hypothetical protein IE81DRAFT_339387 [Ceraceosorus guamensis]|uniref:Uncharacterized protein n=1 Tax=Ceraceosorus guamensis TaxID=1522189 RepID=A0A316W6N8_9BASI|nr:hypothetical protein IE81DRAFT_339387 [Ceraceosorus guamensis]PWN45452.1 hypothetical protein IE81DRAFT_339387 [Ceraceosorus guamensis]
MSGIGLSAPPPWLDELLSVIPSMPLPEHEHSKGRRPHLTSKIADLHCHPALEAALHLANGDLYSAHFLVRKSQGGAKELDWGHAILHRLEGDYGNAKCWYTDLSQLQNSHIYTQFWEGQSVTPGQFVDLSAFWHASSQNRWQGSAAQLIYESSSKHSKIKDAFSLPQLKDFESGSRSPPLCKRDVEELSRSEIRAMVEGLAAHHGWVALGYEESWKAIEEQKGGQKGSIEHNAESMILGQSRREF